MLVTNRVLKAHEFQSVAMVGGFLAEVQLVIAAVPGTLGRLGGEAPFEKLKAGLKEFNRLTPKDPTLLRALLALKTDGVIIEILQDAGPNKTARKVWKLKTEDATIANRIARGLEGKADEHVVRGEHLRILLPLDLGNLVKVPNPAEFWDIYSDDPTSAEPSRGSLESVAWHLSRARFDLLEYLGAKRRQKYLTTLSEESGSKFLRGEESKELVQLYQTRRSVSRQGYDSDKEIAEMLEDHLKSKELWPEDLQARDYHNEILQKEGETFEVKLANFNGSMSERERFLLFENPESPINDIPLTDFERELLLRLKPCVDFYLERRERADWLSLIDEDIVLVYAQLPISILEVGEQIRRRVRSSSPKTLEGIIGRHFGTDSAGETDHINLAVVTRELRVLVSEHAKEDIDGHHSGGSNFLLDTLLGSIGDRKDLPEGSLRKLAYWQAHPNPTRPHRAIWLEEENDKPSAVSLVREEAEDFERSM